MDSRISKYNDVREQNGSRVNKNKNLYKTISQSDIDNFDVMSNATVLGENKKNEIDIEKLKKILDNKYNESNKRRSIKLEPEEEEICTDNTDDTKEYDINSILNKARTEKITNYDEDRLKKLRDTQFDILSNLKLDVATPIIEKNDIPAPPSKENNLLDLINTIAINEKKIKEDLDDDFFSDLIGDKDDDTYGPIEKTSKIDPIKSLTTVVPKVSQEENRNIKKEINNTTSFNIKEFADLEIEDKSRNIVLEIIIVIVLVAFLIGMFIFFKDLLNL